MEEQKLYVDIGNVRTEEMRKLWQKIIDEGVDPFAIEHIAKYHKNPILDETEHWFVTENDFPYEGKKNHFIFITKKYYEHFEELSMAEITDLFAFFQKICDQYAIKGGGLIMRFGDTSKSGGTVKHLHAQLIEPEENKKVPAWFGSEKK